MTLVKHELKQGLRTLIVWTVTVGFFMVICVFLFPEMKGEMEDVTDLFASMGAFTEAFGMDRLSLGTFIGFYAVECGNILGMGGAFFASLIAISALSKEEKDRTAEFLLTHPVSRPKIVTEKLIGVILQVVVFNAIILGMSTISGLMIGEKIPWKEIGMLHFAYFLLQVELVGICFGISAFMRRSGLGIGIGIAAIMYFSNLIANISEGAGFLKYITPFGYTEGADIITDGNLSLNLIALGMLYAVIGIGAAYWWYCKKDIY